MEQSLAADSRVPELEPRVGGESRFSYQPLGKRYWVGSEWEDCLFQCVRIDFDTQREGCM